MCRWWSRWHPLRRKTIASGQGDPSPALTDYLVQFFFDLLFRFGFRNVADEESKIRHTSIHFNHLSRSNGVPVELERRPMVSSDRWEESRPYSFARFRWIGLRAIGDKTVPLVKAGRRVNHQTKVPDLTRLFAQWNELVFEHVTRKFADENLGDTHIECRFWTVEQHVLRCGARIGRVHRAAVLRTSVDRQWLRSYSLFDRWFATDETIDAWMGSFPRHPVTFNRASSGPGLNELTVPVTRSAAPCVDGCRACHCLIRLQRKAPRFTTPVKSDWSNSSNNASTSSGHERNCSHTRLSTSLACSLPRSMNERIFCTTDSGTPWAVNMLSWIAGRKTRIRVHVDPSSWMNSEENKGDGVVLYGDGTIGH